MKRFKNILFFADGVTEPGPALERAVALARVNNARLTIIDVVDEHESTAQIQSDFGSNLNEILKEHRRQALEAMLEPFGEPDDIIYTRVTIGTPFIEVIRSVLSNRHDLVIKACRPPEGFSERLLGSNDMHLMRKCPCPVWIERPAAALPYRRILAAVDPVDEESKDSARLVMDLASSLAQRESAKLSVVHVWRLHGESMLRSGFARISEAELERRIEQTRLCHLDGLNALLAHYDLSTDAPEVHLLKGNPAATIDGLTRDLEADLIVMGTVGRTGIPGFFIGNTAEEVLQTTTASVLAVKPPAFISPVTVPQMP
jgi:nucleotide-binding universal stress UspA family protein